MNIYKITPYMLFLFILFIIKNPSYDYININYNQKLKKELLIINKFYKNNMPIINCRKYTSSTNYKKDNIKNIPFNITKVYVSFYDKKKKDILIAIHSHSSLFYHRFVFRRIYNLYNNIQLLFFVGLDYNQTINKKLNNEAKKFKDIVIFNFYCDYNTLYILTFNFLKWIEKYRSYYKVIVKQDTDTFINIPLIDKITKNLIKNNEEFVLGKIWKYNNRERKFPSGMSYTFLSKSIDKLLINVDRIFPKLRRGYGEDLLFAKLARTANITFLDVSIDYNYSIYTKIPKYIKDIKKVYMIHYLRISEIAFFHLILLNKYNYIIL